jgi:hypothetical protein
MNTRVEEEQLERDEFLGATTTAVIAQLHVPEGQVRPRPTPGDEARENTAPWLPYPAAQLAARAAAPIYTAPHEDTECCSAAEPEDANSPGPD